MSCLQTLRNARWLTRLVLVWFALFIGAAVASPMVNPVSGQMVCTAMGGMKMVMDGEDGNTAKPSASMDCPLCMPTAAPTPTVLSAPHPSGLAYALRPLESARLASLITPPWQARGPPPLSF